MKAILEIKNLSDQEGGNQEGQGNNASPKRTSAAALMESFAREYRANRQETQRGEKHRVFREWLTIIGLFLTAAVAGFQWKALHDTDRKIGTQAEIAAGQLEAMKAQLAEMQSTSKQTDTLIATNKRLAEAAAKQADVTETSQRAWLAPISFAFTNLAYAAEPLVVRVVYQNVGREPARGVRNWLGTGYIRNPNPPEPASWGKNGTWFTTSEIVPATMCGKVSSNQQSVVYPSPTFGFSLDIVNGTGPITPSMLPELFIEVKERRTIFFVTGCLSYETLKERRNTTFCAFLNPVPDKAISEWQFSACPVGNDDF